MTGATRAARAVVCLAALAAACAGARARPRHAPLPAIVLARVEGGFLDLSELRGRPVILFFFTTWSGPAQALAPFVSQVARRHGEDELAVVGVALEPDAAPVVEAWRDFVAVPFPVVLADRDFVEGRSPLGAIPAVPCFAFLDRRGALVGWNVRLLFESELERIAQELLAGDTR